MACDDLEYILENLYWVEAVVVEFVVAQLVAEKLDVPFQPQKEDQKFICIKRHQNLNNQYNFHHFFLVLGYCGQYQK